MRSCTANKARPTRGRAPPRLETFNGTFCSGDEAMPKSVRNGIVVTLLILTSVLLGQDREKPAAKPASGGSKDEAQIRANIDAFVKAYNSARRESD